MSTPCMINITESDGTAEASIYKHWDGDPETMEPMLNKFLADVESQCGQDTRFNDTSYLASKLVVWLARHYAPEYAEAPLNFISVGICKPGADYGQCYTYRLACQREGRPVLTQEP